MDQTCFFMHQRLSGPRGLVENRGRNPEFLTSPSDMFDFRHRNFVTANTAKDQ